MDVSAKRGHDGECLLELGPVTLTLSDQVIQALHDVIEQRLNQSGAQQAEELHRKLQAYRTLASKISEVDDRILQKFAPQVPAEQLVTLARLAEGDRLREKILKNLSKQNRRQFEEDEKSLDKITEQHACIYMEKLVPTLKKVAQEQKALQAELEAEKSGG
ncbi:FliG C-terminal domain-containing protein [Thiomicrorhabdus sp. zzn3]|uniref:FliG C-terminal domain-containing protein n=1 Tax=Thiomicrorhabdus sp. zzn3 TaxID=3039775 RepID=UPI002436A212|nr:FliG C-terminal domain-containing protein [Thiomicrorhabdus sp. zzn3]MDG6777229.1 FliG C-terminal domain-containing protein [Thiomicrorhabdus sp. zzn3]